MTAETDDTFERKIVANVREHGCHVNFVFDPDGKEPDFAYSVGFTETVRQPEVIVFGLSQQVMHHMVNETYRQCRDGLILVDGIELDGLLEGHRCVALAISKANIRREHFNSAMWFRQFSSGEEMDAAFQIVWPGAQDGLFPWDEGCSQIVCDLQPALFSGGDSA